MSVKKWVFVFPVFFLLNACSGDSAFVGTGTTRLNNVEYEIKQLLFTWPSVAEANTYRVLENPDGVSGYTAISGDLSPDTSAFDYDIAVHLQEWNAASYILQSCLGADCVSSSAKFATDSRAAIGYLKASNTGMDDNFGHAVAVSNDGNTVAVGTWREQSNPAAGEVDNTLPNSGAVYVFRRVAKVWEGPVLLKASNADVNDRFGFDVALSSNGDTLAVGARNEASADAADPDNNLAAGAGAVYIFVRDLAGDWSEEAYIKASNAGTGDNFGWSVALSNDGNLLAVGAPGEDGETGLLTDSGAVYTYIRNNASWSEQAYVKPAEVEGGDSFGSALSLNAGGTLFAGGAPQDNDGGHINNGAVYIFSFADTTWSQTTVLRASNAGTNDFFGTSLALSNDGTSLVVGAPFEDSDGLSDNDSEIDSGAAYVFASNGNWEEQAMLKAETVRAFDQFGISVAIGTVAGDIVAVGADQEDGAATGVGGDPLQENATNAGAAYLFTRDIEAWTQHAYLKASNTGLGDRFGTAMALSGDGRTLAIGAIGEDSAATGIGGDQGDGLNTLDSGAVYFY